MTTTFGAAPSDAQWYYLAVIDVPGQDTTYVDGYATGDRPTRTALRAYANMDREVKIIEWTVNRTPQAGGPRTVTVAGGHVVDLDSDETQPGDDTEQFEPGYMS